MNYGKPIAVAHTISDTHTGGSVLWGFSELFTVAALAVIFTGWTREEARKAAREDRRLDAIAAAEAVVAAAASEIEREQEHEDKPERSDP